jgi:hypothetical protein
VTVVVMVANPRVVFDTRSSWPSTGPIITPRSSNMLKANVVRKHISTTDLDEMRLRTEEDSRRCSSLGLCEFVKEEAFPPERTDRETCFR